MANPNAAFRRLVEVLDGLRIPFFVGGSVASSIHGVARATMDVDLIAGIEPRHIAQFAAALKEAFYADPDMIRHALSAGRSFNLIHYATTYKFDIFPLGSDPYRRIQLGRAVRAPVSISGGGHVDVLLESPEDTLLSKLAWYRAGGEVSERQWNDIHGIVAIRGGELDRAYLRQWAGYLKVEDLLEQALAYG